MSLNSETVASFCRFVSIAVLSCLLMTGGFWVYHNRAEIVNGVDASGNSGGTWFTRWAGVDATRLKDDHTKNIIGEHATRAPAGFEVGPEMIQQLHKPYTWDGNDR